MAEEIRRTVRLPADIDEALKARARADDRSINSAIVSLLRQALFPTVDADAYQAARRTVGSLPRYTINPYTRRRPQNGGPNN